jgi:MFS family permease
MGRKRRHQHSERSPLLQDTSRDHSNPIKVDFDKFGDAGNPREWSLSRKIAQVVQIFLLALICPMASSVFAPAIDQISEEFGASKQVVLLGQSTFMFGLGTGPLFLAPMSETFGRRPLFVICLALFTLLQIPTALAPDVATFIAIRTLSGLVGSVGVANGGGSIFDMFETHERAMVLGVYLVGPL